MQAQLLNFVINNGFNLSRLMLYKERGRTRGPHLMQLSGQVRCR